jgi:hypothetical protein
MKRGILWTVAVLVLLGPPTADAARPGVASVTLKQASSPGDGPVLVLQTKGAISNPVKVLAFQTQATFIEANKTRRGRWIVSRETEGGPRLLSRMQADLRDEGVSRVKGGVAVDTPRGGRLDYFKIKKFGEKSYPRPSPER